MTEEISSDELRKFIEDIGVASSPATSKNDDCSSCTYDCTRMNSDTTKYRGDSSAGGGTDTIRSSDKCNDKAAQNILKAINEYNKNSNNVISGDLMEYESENIFYK